MEISKTQYARLVLEMEACPHYGSLSPELKRRLYLLSTQKADKYSVCSALGLAVPASSASSSASSAIPSMDYEKQTVAQLKELCAQRGLSTPTKAKKADYIEILKSAAAPVAASDDVPSAAALGEPVVTSDISESNPSHPDTAVALMTAPHVPAASDADQLFIINASAEPAATGALESSAPVSDSADRNAAVALMTAPHVPAASGADELGINESAVPAASDALGMANPDDVNHQRLSSADLSQSHDLHSEAPAVPASSESSASSAPVSDSTAPNTTVALMPAPHVPAASDADEPGINASAVPAATGTLVSASPEKRQRDLSPPLFIATTKGVARKHYQIHFGQGIPNPIFDQVSSSTSTRLKSLSHTPLRKQIVSRIVLHV